jgi:hypothetical protein
MIDHHIMNAIPSSPRTLKLRFLLHLQDGWGNDSLALQVL